MNSFMAFHGQGKVKRRDVEVGMKKDSTEGNDNNEKVEEENVKGKE